MAFPWMTGRQANREKRQAVGSSKTEVEQLAVATAKTMIGLEGRVRAMDGVTSRTFLLPKGHGLGRAGMAAGARYFEVVQAAGKNHVHGMPHPVIVAAVLAAVEGYMTKGPEKEKIQMLNQEHAGGPQFQGQSSVVHVQGAATQNGEECMEMIARCIQGTGGEGKMGPAPGGPAARHLVNLLKEMGQWEERD